MPDENEPPPPPTDPAETPPPPTDPDDAETSAAPFVAPVEVRVGGRPSARVEHFPGVPRTRKVDGNPDDPPPSE